MQAGSTRLIIGLLLASLTAPLESCCAEQPVSHPQPVERQMNIQETDLPQTNAQGANTPADGEKPVGPIAVAPLVFSGPLAEYEGIDRWGLDQWEPEQVRTLFEDMAHDGIKQVLLPICFGEEVCYTSDILPNKLPYDGYAFLFELAEEHGLEVILPGISYTYHLQFQGAPWDPATDLEMNKRIFSELAERYGQHPNLWGWYIPHETGDRIHRGDVMLLLRKLPPFLKSLTPDKKVAHSPWFTSPLTVGGDATTPEEFAAEWEAMLQEIKGIDVFAIQDSTAPHEEIEAWFTAAAPVFRQHGSEVWSVVELFPREPEFTMGRAVKFGRVLEKIQAASPHVDGYACWEYQNYLNPKSPLQGAAELSREYRAHFGMKEAVTRRSED